MSAIQAELPKLTLRDAPEENSFSSVSSPAPGPLSPPLGPMDSDIGDLQDVPINDNADILPSVMQTQSIDTVYFRLFHCYKKLKKYAALYVMSIYRYQQIHPTFS